MCNIAYCTVFTCLGFSFLGFLGILLATGSSSIHTATNADKMMEPSLAFFLAALFYLIAFIALLYVKKKREAKLRLQREHLSNADNRNRGISLQEIRNVGRPEYVPFANSDN